MCVCASPYIVHSIHSCDFSALPLCILEGGYLGNIAMNKRQKVQLYVAHLSNFTFIPACPRHIFSVPRTICCILYMTQACSKGPSRDVRCCACASSLVCIDVCMCILYIFIVTVFVHGALELLLHVCHNLPDKMAKLPACCTVFLTMGLISGRLRSRERGWSWATPHGVSGPACVVASVSKRRASHSLVRI